MSSHAVVPGTPTEHVMRCSALLLFRFRVSRLHLVPLVAVGRSLPRLAVEAVGVRRHKNLQHACTQCSMLASEPATCPCLSQAEPRCVIRRTRAAHPSHEWRKALSVDCF